MISKCALVGIQMLCGAEAQQGKLNHGVFCNTPQHVLAFADGILRGKGGIEEVVQQVNKRAKRKTGATNVCRVGWMIVQSISENGMVRKDGGWLFLKRITISGYATVFDSEGENIVVRHTYPEPHVMYSFLWRN